MPGVVGVLETALYVEDLSRAMRFYEDVFDLAGSPRTTVSVPSNIAAARYYLLFRRGSLHHCPSTVRRNRAATRRNGSASLRIFHRDLGVCLRGKDIWRKTASPSKAKVHWPLGGQSIYFRDPDQQPRRAGHPGHLAHLLSRAPVGGTSCRALQASTSGFECQVSGVRHRLSWVRNHVSGEPCNFSVAYPALATLSSYVAVPYLLPSTFYFSSGKPLPERAANQNVSHYAKKQRAIARRPNRGTPPTHSFWPADK